MEFTTDIKGADLDVYLKTLETIRINDSAGSLSVIMKRRESESTSAEAMLKR